MSDNVLDLPIREYRESEFDIAPLILSRWSPRSMSGDSIPEPELKRLFEAARWAPSSYNRQPWRFVYALRNTEYWEEFLDLLVGFNAQWARDAAALVIILSRRIPEGEDSPARTHSFDAGAAWQNFALQGSASGLVVHAMSGFDYDRTRRLLDLGEEYAIEAMVAVGVAGPKDDLPGDLEEREEPSGRRPLSAIAFEGRLPESEMAVEPEPATDDE